MFIGGRGFASAAPGATCIIHDVSGSRQGGLSEVIKRLRSEVKSTDGTC